MAVKLARITAGSSSKLTIRVNDWGIGIDHMDPDPARSMSLASDSLSFIEAYLLDDG